MSSKIYLKKLKDLSNACKFIHEFMLNPEATVSKLMLEHDAGKDMIFEKSFLDNCAIGLNSKNNREFAMERLLSNTKFNIETISKELENIRIPELNNLTKSVNILHDEYVTFRKTVLLDLLETNMFNLKGSKIKQDHFLLRLEREYDKVLKSAIYNLSFPCNVNQLCGLLRNALDDVNKIDFKTEYDNKIKSNEDIWSYDKTHAALENLKTMISLSNDKNFEFVLNDGEEKLHTYHLEDINYTYKILSKSEIGKVLNQVLIKNGEIPNNIDVIESLDIIIGNILTLEKNIENRFRVYTELIDTINAIINTNIITHSSNIVKVVGDYIDTKITQSEFDNGVVNNINLTYKVLILSEPIIEQLYIQLEKINYMFTIYTITIGFVNEILNYTMKPSPKLADRA